MKNQFFHCLKTRALSRIWTESLLSHHRSYCHYVVIFFITVTAIFKGTVSAANEHSSAKVPINPSVISAQNRQKGKIQNYNIDRLLDKINYDESSNKAATHNYDIVESLHKASSVEARNGGWGGGTGVIRASQNPLFYDLYLVQSNLQDSIYIQPDLPLTLFFKRVGFDRIRVQNLPEYQGLISLLDSWKDKSPGLIFQLKKALSELSLSYTDIPLKRFDRIKKLPSDIDFNNLVPLITYNRNLGARIYRPIWMLLGDKSRFAALIHEAFRVIELKWSYGISDPEFDAKLQKLTSILVLEKPDQYRDAGELYPYLSSLLKAEVQSMDQYYSAPSFAYNLICEKLWNANFRNINFSKCNEIRTNVSLTKTLTLKDVQSWVIQQKQILGSLQQKNKSPGAIDKIVAYNIESCERLIKIFDGKYILKSDEELKDLYDSLHSGVSKFMIEMEGHLRKYLKSKEDNKYNPFNTWREEDENFFEALADTISFYNVYLQERWTPWQEALTLLDIKTLINLASKRPDLKVFENPKIYKCLLVSDWFADLSVNRDENQGSISTKIDESPEQTIESRIQCIEKLLKN